MFIFGVVEDEEFPVVELGEAGGVHGAALEVGFDDEGGERAARLEAVPPFEVGGVEF